jgi:hypothetical protein
LPRGVAIIKNWERDLLTKLKERLSFFQDRGIPRPTLRAMFYALVSIGLPNTKSYYQSLSAHTVDWREDRIIPIDCFMDESRHVVEDFDDVYESPEDYIDRHIQNLEDAPVDYKDLIPRWHNQPHYVEFWTEKNAQIGILRSILRDGDLDRQVRIVPTGGYGSVSYGIDNVRRLEYWQSIGKKIHIRYFGDLDPSGENIEEVITRKLAQYGLRNIDIKRVALTDDMVDTYDLPRRPDPDTFEKLKRDPRAEQFKAKHNGELFQVEVDALVAIAPDVFRDLVINSVDELFDEDIYEEVLEEYSEENITELLKDAVKSLLKRLKK